MSRWRGRTSGERSSVGKVFQFGEDSRLKGYARRETHRVLPLERTYCANCGKPYGWASQESSQLIAAGEIIVYCEECFESLNKLSDLPMRRVPGEHLRRLGLAGENTA